MIASIPGSKKGVRSSVVTSLVDLLPTIIEIGSNDKEFDEKLSGKSLIPFTNGKGDVSNGIAISDYYHIGPCVPTRMVRKNDFKLIYTHGYPHLLFDLKNDPNELENLASYVSHKSILEDLLSICFNDWDPEEINNDIIRSQKRRLMIKSVPGDPPNWDFVAQAGDDKRYVRREGVDTTKGKLRIPPVKPIPPDMPSLSKEEISLMMQGKKTFVFK